MIRTIAALTLSALVVTGCGGKKDEAAARLPATCDAQAGRYGAVLAAAFVKQGVAVAATAGVAPAVITACKEDQWPERDLGCMSVARDSQIDACVSGLPPELQTKMEERVKATITASSAQP